MLEAAHAAAKTAQATNESALGALSETPHETPRETSHELSHETSHETPHETPHETLCPQSLQPPFDTFIFDLDGTLLDTLDDLTALTNQVLQEEGMPTRTREEINSFVGNGAAALLLQAVPDGTSPERAQECLHRWRAEYDDFPNDLTKPYPGIVELLEELRRRGCKTGVLSNKFDGGVKIIMKKCLPGAVDVAYGEGGPKNFPRKPNPEGLLATIEELDSTPCLTVYVGDSPSDVHVARNAGCYAVGVTWGYHHEADFATEGWEPDLMAHSASDILQLA